MTDNITLEFSSKNSVNYTGALRWLNVGLVNEVPGVKDFQVYICFRNLKKKYTTGDCATKKSVARVELLVANLNVEL